MKVNDVLELLNHETFKIMTKCCVQSLQHVCSGSLVKYELI